MPLTFHVSRTVQIFTYYYFVQFRKIGKIAWKAKIHKPVRLKECKQ